MQKDNWNYYRLFLIEEDRKRLINYLKSERIPKEISNIINDNTNFILDHCTLLHINQAKDNPNLCNYLLDLYEHYYNYNILLGIDAIGYSDKAVAFKCILPLFKSIDICANKIPHITICTLNDGKPIDSNYITNWIEIDLIPANTKIKRI